MRILQVNKFFWQSGGPERYLFELADLLREHGHEVRFFAMQHERNLPCDDQRHFVSPIQYRNTSAWYKVKAAGRTIGKTIYCREAKRKMRALLDAGRPDIAHLHMISRQISPSVLHALRSGGVPVVQTVHNAELVCPAAHCYVEHRREPCERCLGGGYYHAVRHRCVRHSLAASTLVALAQYVHRWSRIYENGVDLFICPSRFLAGKLAAGGIPREKIRHLPNYIDVRRYTPRDEDGRYGVFLGRLSPEKGVMTLLRAASLARQVPLVIVGEGCQAEELQRFAAGARLDNVTFSGYRQGEELLEIIRRAAFVVLPSECYENSPMVIYEGGALGKPVIAADVGGVCELIDEGETGLLFPPGNAEQLADHMLRLDGNRPRCREMGRRGRERIEQVCSRHYERLMALYDEARNHRPGPASQAAVPALPREALALPVSGSPR